MGIIGLLDDYLKVVKKYSKGLIARYKIAGQIILGLFISYMVFNSTNIKYEIINSYSNINNVTHTDSILLPIQSISIPFIKNYSFSIKAMYKSK